MTAIAYRDGVMAADSRWHDDDADVKILAPKIARLDNSWLIGITGDDAPDLRDLVRYLEPFLKKNTPLGRFKLASCGRRKFDFLAMVALPDKAIWTVNHKGEFYPFHTPFMAIGSGSGICLGSMERGASAVQAVEDAIKWSPYCEGPVHQESL